VKELDVFRYLKKYRAVIAGISILAGAVFYLAARFYVQQYTAQRSSNTPEAGRRRGSRRTEAPLIPLKSIPPIW